jgi:hypothetical protein
LDLPFEARMTSDPQAQGRLPYRVRREVKRSYFKDPEEASPS